MLRRQWQEVSSSSQSPGNVAAHLQRRESQSRSPHAFRRAALERFPDFTLKRQYDVHVEREDDEKLLSSILRRRSKIIEITPTEHILVTLTFSGVCTAFSRHTKARICIINISPEEVIRSIFWNKENQSLLTISVARGDSSSSLRCRSTLLSDIQNSHPELTTRLFPAESLEWPGFVELDELNRKVITFSSRDCTYKIWDLRSYALLYELKDTNIHEVKVSPGVLLVIYQRPATNAFLSLAIFDIENGKFVHGFKCPLHRTKRIDFIEQYSDKLLIKQVNENLRIVDIQTRSEVIVSHPEIASTRGYLYLYHLQRFLSFDEKSIHTWNFHGDKVNSFEEHVLLHSECPQSTLHISQHQEFVFTLSKAPPHGSACIAVSDVRTGRFLGRFSLPANFTERDLLSSVSAIFYDQAKHELLTGTSDGRVLVWSS